MGSTRMDSELACMFLNTTRDQLSCLNGVKARLYMPVTVFLGLLIVVGTLGNITVCLVYCRRTIRVSSHYFILSLAVLDLITCVIGMPTEMADLILPLTFDSPIACKVLRFLHSSTIIASSTILIEVAFDRYFRICQLGRQFTANKARLLCLGALLLGIIFSWPSCVIFGKKTVSIHIQGHSIQGTDCSTDDSMRKTIYPTIYYLFLFSLFGITLVFFTVLYSRIGLRIVTQNKMRSGASVSGGCSGRGGAGHGGDALRGGGKSSPQEQLAQVLRSGINGDVETPSADLSSEPSSGFHGSHRNSSASGSSGSSGSSCTSGISGSSGSSGVSCRSPRLLVESHLSSRESDVVNNISSALATSCHSNNLSTISVSIGNHAQRKSGSFLDRLQVPSTIHETSSRVKILASNLQPIQPYNYKNRSNEMLNFENSGAAALDDTHESILSANDIDNENGTEENRRYKIQTIQDNGRYEGYNTIPRQLSRGKQKHKSKSKYKSARSLSCCCSCERNETFPNNVSILNRNDGAKNGEHWQQQNGFDEGTLPRNPKERASTSMTTQTTTQHRPCNRQLRVGKTTTVLFAVTLAYILSFLPYLTVMVMRSVVKDLEESLSPMGELAYKLCVKSFFINNAINPIIYSFLNHSFRQDASRMLSKLCGKNRSSPRSGANPAASI